jgi:hypothetical protein
MTYAALLQRSAGVGFVVVSAVEAFEAPKLMMMFRIQKFLGARASV